MGGRCGTSRGRLAASGLALALVLTSCIGSIDRHQFDEEMRARGGGIGPRLATGAVEALADELGADPIELRSLGLNPGQASMEVRVPGRPDQLDAYTYGTSGLYGAGGLEGPVPLQVSAQGPPLESQVFRPDQAGLGRFGAMVDQALDRAGLRGGYVESARIARTGEAPEPVTTIAVTDDRSTVTLTFAPDGSVLDEERS